jgi:hypothetical protein
MDDSRHFFLLFLFTNFFYQPIKNVDILRRHTTAHLWRGIQENVGVTSLLEFNDRKSFFRIVSGWFSTTSTSAKVI